MAAPSITTPVSAALQLPGRDVATSYLRKPPVASALDLIVTELLTQQPEDPERHLLELLVKRHAAKTTTASSSNSNNTTSYPSSSAATVASSNQPLPLPLPQHNHPAFANINMFVSEQDFRGTPSTHDVSHSSGNGHAPRQPVPPSHGSSGSIARSTSSNAAHSLNSTKNSHANSSGGHLRLHNEGAGAAAQAAAAEDLLHWVLDCCLPGSGDVSTTKHRQAMAAAGMPAGAETHPLAFRARQLVTRYTATEIVCRDPFDDEERPLALISPTTTDGAVRNNAIKNSSNGNMSNNNNNKADSDATTTVNRLKTKPSEIIVASGTDAVSGSTTAFASSSPDLLGPGQGNNNSNNNNLRGNSPSMFSPAAMTNLKSAFNLSEVEGRSLMMAVSDAMQIILDWAGDPLLVAENLAGVVKLLVKGERCTVFVADERNSTLRTVIDGKHISVKFGQGIVGRCAAQKAPLVVNNAYSHPSFNPAVDSEVNYITRNILSMPMIVEGHLIAVVQVLNKGDGEGFTEVDVQIFKAFTAVAGIVIRDAMTFPLVLRNCELAEASKDLCTAMLRVNMLNEKDACRDWGRMLRMFLSADCCTVLKVRCPPIDFTAAGPRALAPGLLAPRLEMTFCGTDSEVDFGGFQPNAQRQLIAAALVSRIPELVNNARTDPRFDYQAARRLVQGIAYETSSALLVPVFPFSDDEVSSSTTGQSNYFYAFQFENFRETLIQLPPSRPKVNNTTRLVDDDDEDDDDNISGGGGKKNSISAASNNNNNYKSSPSQQPQQQQQQPQPLSQREDSALMSNASSSSSDIIFSDEAVIHIQRILPFLESLVRTMCLITAQRLQSNLLRETAKTVSMLCEEKLEFADMFDAMSKTVEQMIQRHELRRGSVLFYAKVDSESVDQLQLLPRTSIMTAAGATGGGGGGTTTGTTAGSALAASIAAQQHQQQHASSAASTHVSFKQPTSNAEVFGGLNGLGSNAGSNNTSGGLSSSGSILHPPHVPAAARAAPSFRLRRRGSLSNTSVDHSSQQRMFNVKIPIGTGVVGNGVARSSNATYFTADEVNALYCEGEFGWLVDAGAMPNCPALVVPLTDNKMLLGAMVILRPREEIKERLILTDTGKDINHHLASVHPINLDGLDWRTATPSRLTQVARVDFLAALIAVSKYVLKASNTVTALARQQEGLIFSGELERLATTKQQNAANSDLTLSSELSQSGEKSPARILSATNISQFTFGGKSTASPLEKPLRPEMFDMLTSTSFPIFDFVDGNQPATGLVPLVVSMFRSLQCLEPLNVDEGTLSATILKAFRRYRDVPYHNVFHAFDVTQSTFLFMKMARLDEVLTPTERFALLLAAMFHDIDHNGLNNAYHMKAETAFGMIASMSGQKSVLEYHHCQVAIDVINGMTLLKRTNEEDRRRILRIFFSCILATDMAVHREIMQQMQTQFLAEDGTTRTFEPANIEHRDLALKMLLKMADISNPVKEFALSRRWALAVTEEFYRQGDQERTDGMEVTPMFDRQLNAELSKGQIGFISFMAGPYFTLAAKCFEPYEELTRNMENNLARWKKVQASADDERKRDEAQKAKESKA